MSVNSTVARSATLVMFLSAVSKVLGFVREQAVASQLGAGALTDAYVLANTIAGFTFAIITVILANAVLPLYTTLRARGEQEHAATFIRTVTRYALWICVLIVIAGGLASPWLVRIFGPGLPAQTAIIASQVTAMTFITVGAMTFTVLLSAVLNSHSIFGAPSFSPIIMNVVSIAGVILFTRDFSIWGLVLGTLIGSLMGVVVQIPALRKTPLFSAGAIDTRDKTIGLLWQMSGPLILTAVAGQVYSGVDRALASGLPEGSISALNYAVKVVGLPSGVVVVGIATVMFPRFAQMWGESDKPGLGRALESSITIISAIMVPAALAFLVLADPITRVIYQRGAFGEAAVAMTSMVMRYYALGILFQGVTIICNRLFYAMQDARTPLIITMATCALAVVLDLVLVGPMQQSGLALASSLSSAVSATVLIYLVLGRLGDRSYGAFAKDNAKVFVSTAIMMGVCLLVLRRFPVVAGDLRSVVNFGVSVAAGLVAYGACLLTSGFSAAADLKARAMRFVKNR